MTKRDIVKILVIAAVLLGCVFGADRIAGLQEQEETRIVRDAVRNTALTCYAVEGAYPEDIDYLREHYQLAYNEERYLVTYRWFASNQMPDIYVMERGDTGK